MQLLDIFSTASPMINGIAVPMLTLFIIPKYLRKPVTGEYVGFTEISLLYILLGWATVCVLMIVPDFGFTTEAVTRITICTLLPFVMAYVTVKLTDWAGWDKGTQVRRR